MNTIFEDSDRKIFAVTCTYKDKHFGMIATSFATATISTKYKRAVIVLSKFNDTTRALLRKRKFTICLLSPDQIDAFFILGGRHSLKFNKFKYIPYAEAKSYGPIVKGCAAFCHCTVLKSFATPDRHIFYIRGDFEQINKTKIMVVNRALKALSNKQRKFLDKKYIADIRRDSQCFKE